ncbi:hypothetical protein EV670_3271 [Rivibacter subsaxonicus]|uniref:Uncharacterized protein n=1 Tax=Rivibacter subsaxonicus TaxID=457575 RepID=A0A4V2FSB7_9BURK|nr:hypothetical protein EV670_3271 [Rivibacter subsaxonicus]
MQHPCFADLVSMEFEHGPAKRAATLRERVSIAIDAAVYDLADADSADLLLDDDAHLAKCRSARVEAFA